MLKENIKRKLHAEGEHQEKATCVSDVIVGLTYINRFLLSMFPSLLIF